MSQQPALSELEVEQLRRENRDLQHQLEEMSARLRTLQNERNPLVSLSIGKHQSVKSSLDFEKLWMIANSVPVLLGYIGRDYHFRFINRYYETWFQRPLSEMQGQHLKSVIGDTVFETLEPSYLKCFQGHEVTFEGWVDYPVGRRYVRTRYIPDRTPDGVAGFLVMGVDLTETKNSADEILKATNVTRRILESISDCFFFIDREFIVTDLNSQAIPYFGGEESEIIDRSLFDFCPALRGSELEKQYRFAMATGEAIHLEYSPSDYPGCWFEIWGHPSSEGLSVFFRDISQRKQGEIQIRESEQQLRTALETGRMVAWQYDHRTELVQLSNTAMKVLGVSPERLTLTIEEAIQMIHPADVEKHMTQFQETIENQSRYRSLFRVVHPETGLEIWLEDHAQYIPLDDESYQMVGILQDVTERRRVEQDLQQARYEADAANLAKSQFVANISHEIRTPMTSILGYADILAVHLKNPDNLQCVQTIRRNGQFLLEIINDILDLSKIEAGRLEVSCENVSVIQLAHDLIELIRVRSDERGITLSIEIEGPVPAQIQTDPKRLRQILINLLGNAVKFTETGSVRLVVQHVTESELLRFDVIDTGIGISDDLQKRLFQPFTQADPSVVRQYEGTGLGLSISRRLAEMLGGRITVESQPAVGSTFSLFLPVDGTASGPLIEPSHKDIDVLSPVVPSGRLDCHVLVVDDRRDVRYLAQHFIEEAGGIVLTASNGQEALEVIEQSRLDGTAVDVVVMDVQMPVMDGFTATRRLRENGFTKPIIALTANAMRGDRDRCLAAGYDDYTSKPINGGVLVSLIRSHTEKKTHRPSRVRQALADSNGENSEGGIDF